MKREIKFRAWIENRMLSQDDLTGEGYCPMTLIKVNDCKPIFMQYTGIKDKNGKEIYEGDVLKAHGIVAWNDEEYRWSAIDLNWNDRREWHDIDYLTSPFEVIGNIYENPELIK